MQTQPMLVPYLAYCIPVCLYMIEHYVLAKSSCVIKNQWDKACLLANDPMGFNVRVAVSDFNS